MPESLPQRFEMGTLNIAGIAGLNAALKWIEEQGGVENIWNKEVEHRQKLLALLSAYPFVKIIGNYEKNKYTGIVLCVIDGLPSDTAGAIFSEQGIAVRTGLQCAPLAHQFMGTYPGGTIRFSVGYFTSESDFEALQAALNFIGDNL